MRAGSAVDTITRTCQVAVGLCCAAWLILLWYGLHRPLRFDDAYMFYRYAMNIRHGLGISWNLDGVHTYGETAPLWGFVVLALSYLPMNATQVLHFGSWLFSMGAVLAMAWAVLVATERDGNGLNGWRVLALVTVPLACMENFQHSSLMGMETMFGMMLCSVFLGLVMRWGRGEARPELAGMLGVLLFLTRPEAGLIVVLFPVCCVFLWRRDSVRGLAQMLAVFFGGVVADLLLCRLYFHTALPLSFYMKDKNGYEGYARYWHPTMSLADFLAGCLAYLLLMVWLGRKQDMRMMLSFVIPLACMAVYLNSVLQIMNVYSRYYLPYCPLLVVPALLVLERRMREGRKRWWLQTVWMSSGTALRVAGVALLLLLPWKTLRADVAHAIDRKMEHMEYAYDPVMLKTTGSAKLPELSMTDMWMAVPDQLFASLPAGATVASSEVGYMGARDGQVNVIDLAGLNDTQIALQGFSVSNLLERKPDAIWMPHPDYTWQRGVMLTDPEFLQQYEVYAGAAISGIAIRRDGPHRAQLEANLKAFWEQLYPGVGMPGYVVTSATWSGQKHARVNTQLP